MVRYHDSGCMRICRYEHVHIYSYKTLHTHLYIILRGEYHIYYTITFRVNVLTFAFAFGFMWYEMKYNVATERPYKSTLIFTA